MDALKERNDRTLPMKKLVKTIITADCSILQKKVESIVDELHLQGKVSVDNDSNVTKVSKSNSAIVINDDKRKREGVEDVPTAKSAKLKKDESDKYLALKQEQHEKRVAQSFDRAELWRTGEQAWVCVYFIIL